MSLSPFRALALSAAAAAAVVSLTGCGSILNGVLGAAGAPAEDDVFALAVGDCFTESAMGGSFDGEEVSSVPTVDCSEEHDSELYHTEDLPDGDFPGAEAVSASADEICGPKFEEFVGIAPEESSLYVSYFTPIAEGWAAGDREIACYVYSDEMVTGTLAGAAR
ncbi:MULTISPECIES: septum formation family protein [unclassified Nocardiopsis]|uniref:septum formation family protein n=1 Tax=Nocardiopsis TaxID=2013 RepID=UPI00387B7A10